MCKAFSALITKRNKIYWKAGVDSHEDLREVFKKDVDLKDDKDAPKNTFARIEIHPKNGDYLRPDEWEYFIDEKVKPEWITKKHETLAWSAWKEWKKKIYTFTVKEAIAPIHPFLREPPKKITEKHIALLREWASVRDSVEDSVGDSVWASVWASVRASVWASVRASVGDSVWASVRASVGDSVWASVEASVEAYIGSLFPTIKKWKYVNNRKTPFQKIKGYPFQSAVKLWKMGLVPSFDGNVWRLHGHKDARVLWEGKL